MSDQLRKEKNCLNCGFHVEETFCSYCGQKNVALNENAWHALLHLIGHYFHADGKFFSSLKPLLTKPGFLTTEFWNGRRAKYIHPFQLYIFISLIYFFLYLNQQYKKIELQRKSNFSTLHFEMNTESGLNSSIKLANESTLPDSITNTTPEENTLDSINWFEKVYPVSSTLQNYKDSVAKLPMESKPSFFTNILLLQAAKARESGTNNFIASLLTSTLAKIPKLMFVLIPLMAIILKLLYWRKRIYYLFHLVFTLHIHSFIFLFWSFIFLINFIITIPDWINTFGYIIIGTYLFLAFRKAYPEHWLKRLLKFTTYLFVYLLTLLIGLVSSFIISGLTI
jgi:hypothetical protein